MKEAEKHEQVGCRGADIRAIPALLHLLRAPVLPIEGPGGSGRLLTVAAVSNRLHTVAAS